jgi:hypothetical protein
MTHARIPLLAKRWWFAVDGVWSVSRSPEYPRHRLTMAGDAVIVRVRTPVEAPGRRRAEATIEMRPELSRGSVLARGRQFEV